MTPSTDASLVSGQEIPCNLCGSTEYRVHLPSTLPPEDDPDAWKAYRCTHPGYGVHSRIVTCATCGFVFANPRPPARSIAENYETLEDPVYLKEKEARVRTFEVHMERFETFAGPGEGRCLLDVGAYIGVFVEVANRAGWQAAGLEPSHWGVEQMHAFGLEGVQGRLPDDEEKLGVGTFDAVTMWDVIEHVTEPKETLESAYNLLRPGGWIAVHTMDIDSLFSRIMGKRWPWYMEMHIYYFSRRTLAKMLEDVGFEVAMVKPQGRYLHLGYLTTRLEAYSPFLANLILKTARLVGLEDWAVPLNFGDLVTAYARKPVN